tara:strand:- start:1555 stop:1992 length:438 start_codon:yes stop_codon:yes gene_type:complete
MSGGTNQQRVTLPKFFETALQQQVGMAGDASEAGYVPYYGPDVAAFSPMQEASFQSTDMMADAFGMPTTQGQQYMPEAQNFGGAMGYSSAPIYEGSVNELQTRRPGQAQRIEGFTVDPVSGQPGQFAPSMQPVALEMTAAQKRGK